MATRKRPPKNSHPTHPKPPQNPDSDDNSPVEYQQFITEWHSILDEPPRTIAQVRQEYDDALSFLLLLESRINLLEQSEWAAQEALEGVTLTVSPIKMVYVSARSRSAKARNAERAKRSGDGPRGPAVILQPQEFAPPYLQEICPNAELLYEFIKWVCYAWEASDYKRSLSQADQQYTIEAFHQIVRSVNSYVLVGLTGNVQ